MINKFTGKEMPDVLYKISDMVKFKLTVPDKVPSDYPSYDKYYKDRKNFKYLTIEVFGVVAIVDIYGTFEQNEEPSYDIYVQNFRDSGKDVFVKHIPQSHIICKEYH